MKSMLREPITAIDGVDMARKFYDCLFSSLASMILLCFRFPCRVWPRGRFEFPDVWSRFGFVFCSAGERLGNLGRDFGGDFRSHRDFRPTMSTSRS